MSQNTHTSHAHLTVPVPRIFSQSGMMTASRKAQGDRISRVVDVEQLPAVDVLIVYCGEGDEMVLNTAKAACMCYPDHLIRVIILDDSNSSQLADNLEILKQQMPNLYYATRNLDFKTYSKASNLNFGVRYLESLERYKAPFLAVLDADMIPEPEWLRCVLARFFHNNRAALACPYQRFYNMSAGDPLDINADLRRIECMVDLRDFSDQSLCTGSGFVIRSSALEDIGGFPEDGMQDDLLLSLYLASAGWHCVYVPNPVQWGRAPDTMAAYLRQCQRWTVGLISILDLVRSGRVRKLSREAARNLVLWGIVVCATAFIWTFALVAMPLCVSDREPLIPSHNFRHLRLLLRLATLDFAMQTICQGIMSYYLCFRIPVSGFTVSIWSQPWRALIVFRYFLIPKIFGGDPPNFTPTGIISDNDRELEARASHSRLACCKVVFWDFGAWIYLLILGVTIARTGSWIGEVYGDLFHSSVYRLDPSVLTAAWPPALLLWAAVAKAAWVPVSYGLWPPPVATRDMEARGNFDVKYPSDKLKKDYLRRQGQWPVAVKCLVYLMAHLVMESETPAL